MKDSLPRFQKLGYEVAVELYREVFKVNADLRNLFSLEFLTPKTHTPKAPVGRCPFSGADSLMLPLSMQARILAQTIVDMASKIDDLSSMDSAIERICNKHVSRDIRAEHYGVVAAAFDAAMHAVLKNDLSADEYAAWNSAIGALAGVFIARETTIRESASAKKGGWVGFREFLVEQHVEMSSASAKFVLVPKDKGLVCAAGRGQFSCVRMQVEDFGTIYHNTILHSPASREITAITDFGQQNKAPGGLSNRLGASPMTSKTKSSSSRLDTRSSGTKIPGADPDYGTVINTASSVALPGSIDPSLAGVLITPGRLLSKHAIPGAIVELSVPVGGYSAVGSNGQSGANITGGNSLLRNALAKKGSKVVGGNSLLRHAVTSNTSPMASPTVIGSSPMSSPMTKKSSSTSIPLVTSRSPKAYKSPVAHSTRTESRASEKTESTAPSRTHETGNSAMASESVALTTYAMNKDSNVNAIADSISSMKLADHGLTDDSRAPVTEKISQTAVQPVSPTNVMPVNEIP